MVFAVIQCIAVLVIYILISGFIRNQYKIFLVANIVTCIFSSILSQIPRGLGDNKTYAISTFITALTTIIFNIIFVVICKIGAYGMLTSSLLSNIICSFYIIYRKKIYSYISIKQFKKEILKKLCKYSAPLIPNALSWLVFGSADRVIVSAILGVGTNGILAAAHKFSTIYITIYNIFNMTWTESASLHINDKDNSEFFSKITNKVYAIFSCICFGLIAFMPFIFPVMINEAYKDAYYQIPILMLGSLANVGVGLISVVYIAKKKTREVAKTSIISAIINICVNLILIKFIGLYAASISTLVAYASLLVYRYIDMKKYINLKFDKKLLFSNAIMIIVLLMGYYINNFILNIIIVILTIIYCLVINRHNITFVLKILQSKIQKGSAKDEKQILGK